MQEIKKWILKYGFAYLFAYLIRVVKHRLFYLVISGVIDVVVFLLMSEHTPSFLETYYIEHTVLLVSTLPTLALLWFFRTHDTREAIQKSVESINTNLLTKGMELITDKEVDKRRMGLLILAKLKQDNIGNKHFTSTIDVATRRLDLNDAELSRANLSEINLYRADLRGANLEFANLQGVELFWADLHGARLFEADLHGANLAFSTLKGVEIQGANLHWADLHGTNLDGADLHDVNLKGTNLEGAYLFKANLQGVDLTKATINIYTTLDSITYDKYTKFPDGTNNPPPYCKNPIKKIYKKTEI